jgi:raffinose synthase
LIKLVVQGCGEFGAYSSREPLSVFVNTERTPFKYDPSTGFVQFILPVPFEGEYCDVMLEL